MAEFRLSPRAQQDLSDLFDYTVDKWGLDQALYYTDRIEAACAALAEAPQMARSCDHIRPGYRRYEVESHTVYFSPTDYGIAVVRILHHRMDAARRL